MYKGGAGGAQLSRRCEPPRTALPQRRSRSTPPSTRRRDVEGEIDQRGSAHPGPPAPLPESARCGPCIPQLRSCLLPASAHTPPRRRPLLVSPPCPTLPVAQQPAQAKLPAAAPPSCPSPQSQPERHALRCRCWALPLPSPRASSPFRWHCSLLPCPSCRPSWTSGCASPLQPLPSSPSWISRPSSSFCSRTPKSLQRPRTTLTGFSDESSAAARLRRSDVEAAAALCAASSRKAASRLAVGFFLNAPLRSVYFFNGALWNSSERVGNSARAFNCRRWGGSGPSPTPCAKPLKP